MGSPAARLGDPTVHGGVITVGYPTVQIGGQPAARVSDMHVCPMFTGIIPHVGGPLVIGSWTVLVGGLPQSRVGDQLICVGPPDAVAMGAPTVMVGMSGGGAGFGAIMAGLAMGLGNFAGFQPRTETHYGDNITIEGSAQYQVAVVADLDRFTSTPTGKRWAKKLAGTRHHVTIRPIPASETQANGYTIAGGSGAYIKTGKDGTDTPGPGTDSSIEYNPSLTMTYTAENAKSYHLAPNEVLGHELIHSLHNAEGVNRAEQPDSYPNGDNQEEAQTIGVHGYDKEQTSERQMSEDARGPGSARPDHDSATQIVYQDQNGVWHDTSLDSKGMWRDTQIPAPPGGAPNH